MRSRRLDRPELNVTLLIALLREEEVVEDRSSHRVDDWAAITVRSRSYAALLAVAAGVDVSMVLGAVPADPHTLRRR